MSFNHKDHGLIYVTEFERSEPCYSFDTTMVWYNPDTREYMWYSAAGCSCTWFEEYLTFEDLNSGSFHEVMNVIEGTSVLDNHGESDRQKAMERVLLFDDRLQ